MLVVSSGTIDDVDIGDVVCELNSVSVCAADLFIVRAWWIASSEPASTMGACMMPGHLAIMSSRVANMDCTCQMPTSKTINVAQDTHMEMQRLIAPSLEDRQNQWLSRITVT